MSEGLILIVDDREDNLYLLRALLEGHGYEVVSAANGAQALEAARRRPPSLVISDILMPVMDGFALCRVWKQDEQLKAIPFVFYTATYTDEQDREFALSLGAELFVVKPAEPDALMGVVREAIKLVGHPPAQQLPTGPRPESTGPPEAPEGERDYLQHYNATLVRKLESKMEQLERANAELARDLQTITSAEEALKQSEQRFRGYIDNSPYGVFVADELGRYVEINGAASRLTGYTHEELLRMSIADLTAPESLEWGVREFESLMAKGSSSGTATFLRKDGTKFRGRVDAVRLSASRYLGYLVDVSEEEAAQDQLRSQAALIDLAHDAIIMRDMEDRIVFWNLGAERMYGWSRDEALGWVVPVLLEAQYPESKEAVVATLESTGEWEGEVVHATKTGLRKTVASRWSLKRDPDGKPEAILEINRDITLQVKALDELADSAESLRRTLAGAISALGAQVELRDPYTAGHQRRVAELACSIATELDWDQPRIEALRTAALLHDVGKIVVPTEILNKPGRMSENEMVLIRAHAAAGADTVAMIDFGTNIADVVRQHHERLDGSGYPDGLHGDQVLPAARVLAVADVVEAMASHRPYRPALPVDQAMDEITTGAGVRYDPDVVAACVRVVGRQGLPFAT
jgi:PAS domain S-box-containing protein/putative nucleotidyltransferase with HDIG domain